MTDFSSVRFSFSSASLGVVLLGLFLHLSGGGQELTSAQRQSIDRYVTAEFARQRIPGAEVGIYRDGHILLEQGYGLANVELNVPVRPEMVFQSGSIGKQFTAAAVMILVDRGKIHLNDSILTYFPEAPASWKPILIKNMLSHTSGLAEYETGQRTRPGGDFDLRLDYTEDELVQKIERLPLEFNPGTKWSYCNTNYALLGILIHRVTGQFYGDYLHDHIFAPLGMASTHIISDRDLTPGRVSGYEIEAGQLKNQAFVSPTFNSTADGTLYFNVVDLEKWDHALYGTTLLTRASLDLIFTPFVLNDGKPAGSGYGFGWWIHQVNGHRVLEHTGAWQGFSNLISRYVDDKLTVVVLTNLDAGHSHPGQIERVIAGLVEPALMPKVREAIPDTKPEIAAKLRVLLRETVAGADAGRLYSESAKYKLDPGDAPELRAELPAGWETLPLQLITRFEANGNTTSRFRLGVEGNARRIDLMTDDDLKVLQFDVSSDPDNR